MTTRDEIINKHVEAMAAEINAEAAKTAEQRQQEAIEAKKEAILTELDPLLKSPGRNGAKIKELTAALAVLDGPASVQLNNPLQRVGQVTGPRNVKGEFRSY